MSLQQCCDCCGLGLRVRAEGQLCESNPNLGYPCNHAMLSCCEGEDPLIVPEIRQPPEPETKPQKGGYCLTLGQGIWDSWVRDREQLWFLAKARCSLTFCKDPGSIAICGLRPNFCLDRVLWWPLTVDSVLLFLRW